MKCRVCKCTYEQPCNPPCAWAEPELCTTCRDAACAVAEWMAAGHRPSVSALIREAVAMAAGPPAVVGLQLAAGGLERVKANLKANLKRAVGR